MPNNNIRKINIIKNLSAQTGFSLNLSKKLVNDLIDIVILNINKGYFNLKNIGSFRVIHKKARIGRDPKTKEEFIISQRNSISFSLSKRISEHLNNHE